jgi:hypothetical protein
VRVGGEHPEDDESVRCGEGRGAGSYHILRPNAMSA